MPMSERERHMLVTGTLDTTGIGSSENEDVSQVALVFQEGADKHQPDAPARSEKKTASEDSGQKETKEPEGEKAAPADDKTPKESGSTPPPPPEKAEKKAAPAKKTATKATAKKAAPSAKKS